MRLRILCPPGVAAYLDATEPAVPWLRRQAGAPLPSLSTTSAAPLPWPCPAMARGLEGSHERYAARWFAEKVADPGRCLVLLGIEVMSTVAAGVQIEGVEHRVCGRTR